MPYPERGGGGKQAPLMGMGREGGKGLQYEADGSMGFLFLIKVFSRVQRF